MFKDDQQRSRACRALLATLFGESRLRELWAVDPEWGDALERPTQWMHELCYVGGTLSSGEFVLVQCAMDFWSGGVVACARFADVLYRLDGERLYAVATLAIAMEGGAVDQWIADIEARRTASLRAFRTALRPNEACWTCEACGFEKYPPIEERDVGPCSQCGGALQRRGALCRICTDVVALDAKSCPCGARWAQ